VAFNGATTPAGILLDLAARNVDLALLIALNPDTPDELLGVLRNNAELLVRFVVTARGQGASHPFLPDTSRALHPAVSRPHNSQ